ncbi:MAG: sodium:proton antiporter [Lachnospiraceae bacterium]|nr:sodium:proton antiporter [Lachnospiraceae bacterium]
MDTYRIGRVAGFGLYFAFDGFRVIYTMLATLMWFCSTYISKDYFGHHGDNLMRYQILSMWTFAATLGVFLSNDLYTTFIFFEIMSIPSYAYVAHTEKHESMMAAGTYLAVAVIGGLVMLMGLLLLNNVCGTMNLREVREAAAEVIRKGSTLTLGGAEGELYRTEFHKLCAAGGLILFGFGAKAGSFPLHIWLPKAHPVAPAPASALLSGILTKSGIFGVLILCMEIFHDVDGFGLLICILGMLTMLTGAVLALFSVDLKRTLACSSVSQIGFIMIGCGLIPLLKEECTLALSGAMLYMVNHSLFKLTLFLCAAVVYMKCHKLDLNDIRGFGRNKPILKILFLIGALGISGVPLLSGYVAKTLIHEGIVEFIHVSADSLKTFFSVLEWLYLFSGGMTFAYMTKLFYCLFVDEPSLMLKHSPEKNEDVGIMTYLAIVPPAFLIVAFGLGAKLYISRIAAYMGNFNTYSYNSEQRMILKELKIFSLENLKGSMISIGIGIVLFLLSRKLLCGRDAEGNITYRDLWPKRLDLEELVYRPLLLGFFPFLFRTVGVFVSNTLPKMIFDGVMYVLKAIARFIAGSLDAVIRFLNKTLFKPLYIKEHPTYDMIKARVLGTERTGKIISSTLSYGMMMICVGLIITLLYLLYLLFS